MKKNYQKKLDVQKIQKLSLEKITIAKNQENTKN